MQSDRVGNFEVGTLEIRSGQTRSSAPRRERRTGSHFLMLRR